jgi:hypothetical protein
MKEIAGTVRVHEVEVDSLINKIASSFRLGSMDPPGL